MMKTWLLFFLSFVVVTGFSQPVLEFTPISLSGPSLSQPLDITGCGDNSGRLFITQKGGSVRIIKNNVVLDDYFLDIRSKVINSGERGLLGLAFHPKFPDSPYVYVNYVISGTITNRISRFSLHPNDPNDLDESTELILVEQTGVQTNHKAGDLAFGPDGYLYIGFGDGGGGGDPTKAGQNLETLLAKIIRIDVDHRDGPLNYAIPADNPFVGIAGRDEIWYYGMRNPWRISFDRLTGDFWIGDVGQNLWEEVDMIPAGTPGGLNFGWNCQEGNHPYDPQNCAQGTDFVWPVFEYPHNCNPCPNGKGASLTGGFVYRGSAFPLLYGLYVCTDYVSNYLWMLRQTKSNPVEVEVFTQNGSGIASQVVSFGEDDDGELYACNLDGTLYQVGATSLLPIQWEETKASIVSNGINIEWTVFQKFGIDAFEVQRSLHPVFDNYVSIAQVDPVDGQNNYQYKDLFKQAEFVYYRVAGKRPDGTSEYSPIMRIQANPVSRPSLVYQSDSNLWRVNLPGVWQNGTVTVYDLQGKELSKHKASGDRYVNLTKPIIPGIYVVKVRNETQIWSEEVIW
jgi:glucose/arabinose dehydrogenase